RGPARRRCRRGGRGPRTGTRRARWPACSWGPCWNRRPGPAPRRRGNRQGRVVEETGAARAHVELLVAARGREQRRGREGDERDRRPDEHPLPEAAPARALARAAALAHRLRIDHLCLHARCVDELEIRDRRREDTPPTGGDLRLPVRVMAVLVAEL